ncbi:MAG TPA: hypothetical protein VF734_17870, partial [Pseudonocardiaceae bacterium]
PRSTPPASIILAGRHRIRRHPQIRVIGRLTTARPSVWEPSVGSGGIRRYRTVHGTRSDAAAALVP